MLICGRRGVSDARFRMVCLVVIRYIYLLRCITCTCADVLRMCKFCENAMCTVLINPACKSRHLNGVSERVFIGGTVDYILPFITNVTISISMHKFSVLE